MDVTSSQSNFLSNVTQDDHWKPDVGIAFEPIVQCEFDETQCLFCPRTSPDLVRNIRHMNKSHGLHIDHTGLIVDVASLLAYFHFIIFDAQECLYCGTQRDTRQAVQNHMRDKGHCKYDTSDHDSELRDFYEFPAALPNTKPRQEISSRDSTNSPVDSAKTKSPSTSETSREHHRPFLASTPNSETSMSINTTHSHGELQRLDPSNLTRRAQRHEFKIDKQLANLRAGDRQSLSHLPVSQQISAISTYHKQLETANRVEQSNRSNLASAGNKFNRLSTVRLIRQPPHTGNVSSLNR